MKCFFSKDAYLQEPKATELIGSVVRGLGKGLVFSEGQTWKKKRRVLNKLFTFDLIKQLCFSIEEICDKALTKSERTAKIAEDGSF